MDLRAAGYEFVDWIQLAHNISEMKIFIDAGFRSWAAV
jgi:hypothetical protein